MTNRQRRTGLLNRIFGSQSGGEASNKRFKRRQLFESLEDRRLLAADPLESGSFTTGGIGDAPEELYASAITAPLPVSQLYADPPAGAAATQTPAGLPALGGSASGSRSGSSLAFATAGATATDGVAEADYAPGRWLSEGPVGTNSSVLQGLSPANSISGATQTVLAHPTDPDILYVGTVNGGLWKTTNATATVPSWEAQTDDLASLSIGAMAFDPTDATHQSLVAVTASVSSFGRLSGTVGLVYVTNDGGQTWTDPGSAGLRGENLSGVAIRGNVITVTSVSGTSGGIFRSTDGGATFSRIIDADFGFGDNFSDLVEDPTNVNRLYAANPSNNGSGGPGGIYRSDNFGINWAKISGPAASANLNALLIRSNNIEMAVSPTTGRLYVAALVSGQPEGVFHSSNATSGAPSWTRMDVPRLPQDVAMPLTGASNTTPIVITSANHGINDPNQFVAIDGVLGNTAANGYFRVNVVDANRFELINSTGNGAYVGGGTWTPVASPNPRPKEVDEAGGQGSIHFSITADPTDENIVYVGGDRQDTPSLIGAINNSGAIFRGDARLPSNPNLSTSPQWDHITNLPADFDAEAGTVSNSAPHADSREMTFDAAGNLIEVDDGGVYKRTNPRDNTGDWFSLVGNLTAQEFHNVAYDSVSNTIIGGLQDNGTLTQPSFGASFWNAISAGDGGDVAVDDVSLAASGQSIRYSSFQNLGAFRKTTWDANGTLLSTEFPSLTVTSGPAFDPAFTTPVAVNNVDPNRLLFGMDNGIYESTDQGATIAAVEQNAIPTNTIQGNAISYGGRSGGVDNVNAAYVGDFFGDIYVRTGAGAFTVTDPGGGTIRDVEMDPDEFNSAFAIDSNQVFSTINAGVNWTDITGNLGALSTGVFRSLEYIGGVTDALLLGTDVGVFSMLVSAIGIWQELGTDLPNAIVFDMDYDAADDVLVVGTMGRGVWSLDNASSVINPVVGQTNVTLDASNNLRIVDQTGDHDDLLTIQSDTTNNRFIISGVGQTLNTTITGSTGSGTSSITIPFGSVAGDTVTIETLAGQDSVVLDYSLGSFNKSINVIGSDVDSGQGDQLSLRGGGPVATVTFTAAGPDAGTVDVTGNSTITYSGLASVHSDLAVATADLDYSDDAETMFISAFGDTNNGVHIASSGGANVSMRLPTTLLDIHAGDVGLNEIEMIGPLDLAGGSFLLSGDDVVLSGAAILTTGAGSILIDADRRMFLDDNTRLFTGDGDIRLRGNQTLTPASGDFNGITMVSAMLQTDTGNIVLQGRGGDQVGGRFNRGIGMFNRTVIRSTGTGPAVGTIALTGRGGDGSDGNRGIQIGDGPVVVTTVDGDIVFDGTTGDNTDDFNQGIITFGSPTIQTTGVGADAGSITILGASGNGTSSGVGVFLNGGGVNIASTDGNVVVEGRGGRGGNFNTGVVIQDEVLIASTGTGPSAAGITINAVGGDGGNNNRGLELNDTSLISSIDGDVTLLGQGTTAAGSGNDGIRFFGGTVRSGGAGAITVAGDGTGTFGDGVQVGGDAVIESLTTGDITLRGTSTETNVSGIFINEDSRVGSDLGTGTLTLIADRLGFDDAASIAGSGDLTIAPENPGTSIGVSGGAGTLNINDTEISRLSPSLNRIIFGDAISGSGDIDLPTVTLANNATFVGGNIDIDRIDLGTNDLELNARAGVINDTDVATDIVAGSVTLSGGVAPGQSPGVLRAAANLVLSDANLQLEFGGPTPGTAANQRDQIEVTGSVTIGPDATLTLTSLNGFAPVLNDRFVLIANDGVDPVIGSFVTSTISDVLGSGFAGLITYTGGDGNDVELRIGASVRVDSAGNLVVTDPTGTQDDLLTIVVEGSNYRVTDPINPLTAGPGTTQFGTNSVLIPIARVTGAINIATDGGDDLLTIDISGGAFTSAINFDGGAGGNDALALAGGTATDLTFNYVTENDGSVQIDAAPLITYVGLEPITSSIDAVNVTLNYSAADDAITVSDAGGGQTTVDSNVGEVTTFDNPTGTLTINGGDGVDLVDVGALAAGYTASVTVDTGADGGGITVGGDLLLAADRSLSLTADTITLAASVQVLLSGTGAATLTSAGPTTVSSGVSIITGDGAIEINAGMAPPAGTLFDGLSLDNASIQTLGAGDITIGATAGGGVGAADLLGIRLTNSVIGAAGTGAVDVQGIGAAGSSVMLGVELRLGSTISSTGGGVTVTGTGGGDPGSLNNIGVVLGEGSAVTDTGGGNVLVNGTGGAGGSSSAGVLLFSDTTVVGLTGGTVGDVTVIGTGGDGTGSSNSGVEIDAGAAVLAGDGVLTISGTGGAGNFAARGISVIGDGTRISSTSGPINLTGQGGAGQNANVGIYLDGLGGTAVIGSDSGEITLDRYRRGRRSIERIRQSWDSNPRWREGCDVYGRYQI